MTNGETRTFTESQFKSWNAELLKFAFKPQKGHDKDRITIQFLLKFGRFTKELKCTVDMAYTRLRLMAQDWQDSRLAALQTAVENSKEELDLSETKDPSWKTVMSTIARLALPTDQLQVVMQEWREEEYKGIHHYQSRLKRYLELITLLGLEKPTDRMILLQLEEALGAAVKHGRIKKQILNDFVKIGATTIREALDALHQIESAVEKSERLEARGSSAGSGDAISKTSSRSNTSGNTTGCTHCGMSNHSVDKCKTKLYGPVCDNCGQRHPGPCTNPKKSSKRNAKTNRVYDAEETVTYQADTTAIGGIDYVPVFSKLAIPSKENKEQLTAVFAFVDPGARVSLVSQAFYETTLATLGYVTFKGTTMIVKGVDHTGQGIRTSDHVTVTWRFPNGKELETDLVVVPHLPEPILLGRDWQRKAGVLMSQGDSAEDCYCEARLGQLKEPFLKESEYRKKINPQGERAAKELQKSARNRKIKSGRAKANGKNQAENHF